MNSSIYTTSKHEVDTMFPSRARIKIIPNELKEFYVPGDVISGKLVLTLLDSSYSFKEVSLSASCQESCVYRSLSCSSVTHMGFKNRFDSLVARCNASGHGQFESEFSITLEQDKFCSSLPSLSLEKFGGSSFGGVAWKIKAEAQISRKPLERIGSIEDSVPIEVYPYDTSCLAINERRQSTFYPHPIWLVKSYSHPYRLPQWPKTFITEVEFRYKLNTPLESVEIKLRRRIIATDGKKAEMLTEMMTCAEVRDVRVDEANKKFEFVCQLKRREPPSFASRFFYVQYMLCVEIEGERVFLDFVDIMPPSRQLEHSVKPCPPKEKPQIDAPLSPASPVYLA